MEIIGVIVIGGLTALVITVGGLIGVYVLRVKAGILSEDRGIEDMAGLSEDVIDTITEVK